MVESTLLSSSIRQNCGRKIGATAENQVVRLIKAFLSLAARVHQPNGPPGGDGASHLPKHCSHYAPIVHLQPEIDRVGPVCPSTNNFDALAGNKLFCLSEPSTFSQKFEHPACVAVQGDGVVEIQEYLLVGVGNFRDFLD